MARIEGVSDETAGLMARIAFWLAKRIVGKVPEPLRISARHPRIFEAYGAYEFALDRARLVSPALKALASMKAALLVGCPF